MLGSYRRRILRLAARYGVKKVRVFGSVARREAAARSDVDFLVEFGPTGSSLERFRMAEELARLLGRPVDVATAENLHWLIRPQVLAEAVPL